MEPNSVPFIPETAPFTPEQRAYLNGLFAGLFSRTNPQPIPSRASPGATSLRPLTILFGSQTGNAEALAKKTATAAGKRGFAPAIIEMSQYAKESLKSETNLLLITSTYGDGDPPDNAAAFWEFLKSEQAPAVPQLRFSVLALGDSSYEKFCQCGKHFDQRLGELGAQRVCPRVDCDVDYEEPFRKWHEAVLGGLLPEHEKTQHAPAAQLQPASVEAPADAPYSRAHPCLARMLTNRRLNAPDSAKDTRHFEISLDGSGLNYEVGDALGVMPANCPELVSDLLTALACNGETAVPGPHGQEVPLRAALLTDYEITRIPQSLLRAVAERSQDPVLKKLTAPDVNGELKEFLLGREIIDLLLGFPGVKFSPAEFVSLLKKLRPRLYSISSSLKAHPGEVHLTVNAVRYASHGRGRKGVCSTFLADRVQREMRVPIFIQPNRGFRLPADPSKPIIMVGPGTGIAPFRAFLEDRKASGATGKTWLLFGDQHKKWDFLYGEQLQAMLREGTLTKLSTAFSRDQAEKIYVQHRMIEESKELYRWLEEGATFYVCGDANRMAKDVHQALHQIIEQAGAQSAEQAAASVAKLQSEKRYQRDIY